MLSMPLEVLKQLLDMGAQDLLTIVGYLMMQEHWIMTLLPILQAIGTVHLIRMPRPIWEAMVQPFQPTLLTMWRETMQVIMTIPVCRMLVLLY